MDHLTDADRAAIARMQSYLNNQEKPAPRPAAPPVFYRPPPPEPRRGLGFWGWTGITIVALFVGVCILGQTNGPPTSPPYAYDQTASSSQMNLCGIMLLTAATARDARARGENYWGVMGSLERQSGSEQVKAAMRKAIQIGWSAPDSATMHQSVQRECR